MSPVHTIDAPSGVGLVFLAGSLTGADLIRTFEALITDAAWCPTYSDLWDTRYVTSIDLRPTDLPALNEARCHFARRYATGRTAVVAPGSAAQFAAQIVQGYSYRSRRAMEIFDRIDPAWTWLGRTAAAPALDALLARQVRSAMDAY